MEIKETETTSERANPRSHPSSRKVRRHQMDAPLSNTHTKKPKNKSVEKACAVIEERGRKRISPGRNRGKTRAGKHPKYNSNAGRGTERENAPRKSRSSFIRFSLFCSLLYRRRPFAFPNEITRNAEQTREEKNRLRRSALLFLRHPPHLFFFVCFPPLSFSAMAATTILSTIVNCLLPFPTFLLARSRCNLSRAQQTTQFVSLLLFLVETIRVIAASPVLRLLTWSPFTPSPRTLHPSPLTVLPRHARVPFHVWRWRGFGVEHSHESIMRPRRRNTRLSKQDSRAKGTIRRIVNSRCKNRAQISSPGRSRSKAT